MTALWVNTADSAHLPRAPSQADTFEWCGGQYSQTDLKQALAMLLSIELRSHQLLAQQYEDPYQPATWCILNANGQLLLDNLAQASACQVIPYSPAGAVDL